ncbi:MAG: VWA domain-containing protein, partial [Candidatus Poribacteria bacterium]|nr:VWA domain-containing protein [Candidatus Poribacteria bacterium]
MRFAYFWQLWQVILVLAMVIGITSFVYIRLKSPVTTRVRAILICLRILAATILLVCLLEPVLVQQIDITPPNNLLILADRSKSMKIRDVSYNDEKVDRMFPVNQLLFSQDSDFVKQLNDRFTTHIYQFDQNLERITGKTLEIHTGTGLTDITKSIQTAINEWRGQAISGIVLITDGEHNASKFDVNQLVDIKVPIYPIGVGNPNPQNDLGIIRIE